EGKIEILKRCKSYIKHIEDAKIAQILPRFRPTSNFSELSNVDCIIICVPTPLNKLSCFFTRKGKSR
ncbi:MAG: hypothetical protein QXO33_04435, partial [Nitrososphaeria archaeon]